MAWSDRQYGFERPSANQDRPLGTWWIIGVTLGVSVLIWGLGGGVRGAGANATIDWLAVERSELYGPQIWRFVTYMVLHGGPGHLFFNMLVLFFLGRILEVYLGTKRFVLLYVAFGVCGVLGFALEPLFTSSPSIGVIGASGAVMGLVALLGSRFPRMQIMLWGVIPMTCWVLAALLIGFDVLQIIANRGQDYVAHSVHLAGAFGGFFYGFLWPKLEVKIAARQEIFERARRRRREEKKVQDNVEMDRILQKINEEGMDRLSARERQFLLAQSEKLKNQRKLQKK